MGNIYVYNNHVIESFFDMNHSELFCGCVEEFCVYLDQNIWHYT